MKKIIVNSLWVIMERSCLIIAGLLSSIYVARYLGPENYGVMSYLISLVALIIPFVQLGSDNVIFNRIAKYRDSGISLMKAALIFKLVLFGLFFSILLAWAHFALPPAQQKILCILVVASLFTVCDIYKIFYDATLASKVNMIINNSALIIFVAINLLMVYHHFSLFWFALPMAIRSMIPLVIRRILFKYSNEHQYVVSVKKSTKIKHLFLYNIYLLKVGVPLAISSLAITIYTRIDQIFLANFWGYHEVGIYNAALAICQGWTMVPMALITSCMVLIANERDIHLNNQKIRFLYLIILLISIPMILILAIFGNKIIELAYGKSFIDTATILWICALTSLCSVLGTLAYRVILLHSGYKFVAIKMPIVALINISLNYYFIPKFGIKGAAFSTLTAEVFSLFFLNALFKEGLVTAPLFRAHKSLPSLITGVKTYVKSSCQASQ